MVADFSIQDWFESRDAQRQGFLDGAGWGGATLSPVGEDCAFRRYFRVSRPDDSRTMILMESVPDDSPHATQGHRVDDFVRLSAYLRGCDLHAPEIYRVDLEQGYVLLEDFGDVSFKKALESGVPREEAYELATDVLLHIYKGTAGDETLALAPFEGSYLHKSKQRLVEWYMPALRQEPVDPALTAEYNDVWHRLEASLPPCPQGFVHADFHFENLMWIDSAEGLSRAGILDYQGALKGPLAYDLGNLLEDARLDVPEDLRQAMLVRFCAGMDAPEEEAFRAWYRVLATQFHCRLMGQFVRLAVNDKKPRYMQFLPRVAGYLCEGLKDPVMAPVAEWLSAQGVTIEGLQGLDHIATAQFINDGAY